MATVVIVLAIVAVLAVVGWFAFGRQHPENAAAHPGPTGAVRYRGVTDDRPAGPGAEAEGVVGRGSIAPGAMPQGDSADPDAHEPPWSPS